MTVAKLLIFVVTLVALLAAVTLGYVWVQDRQAASFARPLGVVSTPVDFLMRYSSAPAIVCTEEEHSFTVSGYATLYVYNGKIRMDSIASSGLKTHILIDASGAYAWAENADGNSDVYHEEPDANTTVFSDLRDIGNSTWDSCKPWWSPDDSLFKIPLASIVHEAR